ncbi:MAG TPA: glycoside hydrolase family 3 N-terminal domain-containing protein, partial [Pseudomonadales bacterium]|nr:glycoside hydrolase family 3 N-terminal domain-containing protein [Pseudomonadales bacterium]
ATALEVSATAIDWIFAPTVAVSKDVRWGRAYESFSSQPQIVSDYSTAIIRGIQSTGLGATAKHFIGDGATVRGDDQGDVVLALDELIGVHGAGYVSAIEAGVQGVMASFNSWHGDKLHGHRFLLNDVLRDQMGFNGMVVGDWNGHGQVRGCTNSSCAQAINAGVDLIMVPEDWKEMLFNTVRQVQEGVISEARINEAVKRILTMKKELGLFEKAIDRPSISVVGSPEHRAIAREAVRKSLVLLKNQGSLPLSPKGNYLVMGEASDNIGQQSGGWTITWQGTGNNNSDFPGGTSIYAGIKAAVESAGGSVSLNAWDDSKGQPDAVVWVFGERPYAEGLGDIEHLDFVHMNPDELTRAKAFADAGVPVVSVFISGRPMWVNEELNLSDAFVAAWLPGSEGVGVADVLVATEAGAANVDFTGVLSFDWPKLPVNVNNPDAPVDDILFPYGYGLNYASEVTPWTPLGETAVGISASTDVAIFNRGMRGDWQLSLHDAQGEKAVNASIVNSPSGKVRVATTDIEVQEDGLLFTWQGEGGFRMAADSAQDISGAQGSSLQFSVTLPKGAPDSFVLSMDCGETCKGSLDIAKELGALEKHNWHIVAIDTACFTDDMSAVKAVVDVAASGDFQLTIRDVRIAKTSVVPVTKCQ